jgi:prophage antirepressor-like protein
VFKSKLSSALDFQDWVFEEVIPLIHKTDKYVNQDLTDHIQKLELENLTLTTDIQNKDDIIKNTNKEIKSKAHFVAQWLWQLLCFLC